MGRSGLVAISVVIAVVVAMAPVVPVVPAAPVVPPAPVAVAIPIAVAIAVAIPIAVAISIAVAVTVVVAIRASEGRGGIAEVKSSTSGKAGDRPHHRQSKQSKKPTVAHGAPPIQIESRGSLPGVAKVRQICAAEDEWLFIKKIGNGAERRGGFFGRRRKKNTPT